MNFYAHSKSAADGTPLPQTEWEPLFTGKGQGHLEKVAVLCSELAEEMFAESTEKSKAISELAHSLTLTHQSNFCN